MITHDVKTYVIHETGECFPNQMSLVRALDSTKWSVRKALQSGNAVFGTDLHVYCDVIQHETKKCPNCGQVKPCGDFYVLNTGRSKGKLAGWCKQCSSTYNRTAHSNWKRNLYKNYNITPEQYDEMCERQNGVCAICGEPEVMSNQFGVRRLCVDHCHNTGKVRGLLCARCNLAIGQINDSVELLDSMKAYLLMENLNERKYS